MSQNGSSTVLTPAHSNSPQDACEDLTTLLHQTLACAMAIRSHVAHPSRESQGQDATLYPLVRAVMLAALDTYTALVAEHLAELDWTAVGTTDTTTSNTSSVSPM